MGFLISGVFWGAVLILIGLTVIINVVFGIKIPLFRIIFALVLIYLGIRLLTGVSFWRSTPKSAVFEEKRIEAGAEDKYEVVFGKGEIDLSGIQAVDKDVKLEINTIFGSSVVKIDPRQPIKVKVASAFAGARMPDGNTIAFGEYTYRSEGLKNSEHAILVDATVLFGGIEVLVDQGPAPAEAGPGEMQAQPKGTKIEKDK